MCKKQKKIIFRFTFQKGDFLHITADKQNRCFDTNTSFVPSFYHFFHIFDSDFKPKIQNIDKNKQIFHYILYFSTNANQFLYCNIRLFFLYKMAILCLSALW